MAILLEPVNFDQAFKQLKKEPIIINDIKFYSEKERADLIRKFLTEYNSDKISTIPQCDCGELIGEYLVGESCSICNTQVQNKAEEDIEPIFWLRSPIGVAKLINPRVWMMLRNRFKANIIDYFTIVKLDKAIDPKLEKQIEQIGIERGYNYFVENFDFIISSLLSMSRFRFNKKEGRDYFVEFLGRYKDCIFSDYIPIPHKDLLVMENVKNASYTDSTSKDAMTAFNLMAGIDKKLAEKPLVSRMDRTAKALNMICDYYQKFDSTYLGKKEGIFRHHIYSTRTHFSFRAVISSLTVPHQYDEIHIPWGVGIGVFKLHILNRLLKMGYEHNDALGFIYRCVSNYHPLMGQILDDIIDSNPNKSIPVLFNRNPTLLMGSVQKLRITRIKKDLEDNTIGLSILLVAFYNAKLLAL
jgi:DNA-directed RNA polymerase, beta'' subunit/160 kD subunit